MKFSIVTPNYNYGRFLKKALESVLAQADAPGAPEIEHIVIDGGSTDDSVQILKDWADFAAAQPAAKAGRYSFAYVSEPDDGQTDAINKGLRRATGDIVAWLNADEWYLPGKLALVAAAFAKHPDADFVYGEPLFVDTDGNPLRVKRDHPFSQFVLLFGGCIISSCAAFWRKRILDEGIFLDERYKVAMDYEYYSRICRKGFRFRFLPAVIAAFIWHDGNVSIRLKKTNGDECHQIWLKYSPVPNFMKNRLCSMAGYYVARGFRRLLMGLRLMLLPKETINS